MASFDKGPYIVPVLSTAAAVNTANLTGATIDLAGFEGALIVLSAGAVTAGTYTPIVYEASLANMSDAVAVDDSFMVGGAGELVNQEAAAIINATNQIKKISYIGKKQYIRVDLVSASGNMVIGAQVLKVAPKSI